jgi:hypothetical protein
MGIEIARLANISWLQVPDLQASIMRMTLATSIDTQTGSRPASGNEALPLPALDWPSKLFDDEAVCH